ncbi:MAG: hypothetical protein J6T15_03825 [Bacilli bacterium]|nr:hypothetical protein [Bacilli bacterium]
MYFEYTDYLVALYDTHKHGSTYHTFNTQKVAFDFMQKHTNDIVKAKIWKCFWYCDDDDGYVDDENVTKTKIFDNYTTYFNKNK